MRCGTVRVGVGFGIALLSLNCLATSGCIRRVRRSEPAPTATTTTATTTSATTTTTTTTTNQAGSEFSAHALPVFRLVTNEALIDSPSRLLVLQVRLESVGEGGYAFTPQDLTIALPDGTQGRFFDRPRALELLRRTTIADADFNYLQRDGHAPGGIDPYSRVPLAEMVGNNLLSNGSFSQGAALQGYLVVDIGTARTSLDGAVVEVVAHRLADATPSRSTFQLATVPRAGTAQ